MSPMRHILLIVLMAGAAITAAYGGSAAGVYVAPPAIALAADGRSAGDDALLSAGGMSTAFAVPGSRGAWGPHRQAHSARHELVTLSTGCPAVRMRNASSEHCQQLHFTRAGADGLHTSTPPPTS